MGPSAQPRTSASSLSTSARHSAAVFMRGLYSFVMAKANPRSGQSAGQSVPSTSASRPHRSHYRKARWLPGGLPSTDRQSRRASATIRWSAYAMPPLQQRRASPALTFAVGPDVGSTRTPDPNHPRPKSGWPPQSCARDSRSIRTVPYPKMSAMGRMLPGGLQLPRLESGHFPAPTWIRNIT